MRARVKHATPSTHDAMVDGPAHRRFSSIAQKWRDLAERRRDYYAELYRSGRWKRYYTEQELIERMREVADAVDQWGEIAPRSVAAPDKEFTKELTVDQILAARRRDAA
jgi:uncharacterized repeat protein (TIGR03809 family)